MNNTELKACPFCGGEAVIDREDIFCDVCHLSMRIYARLHNGEAETYEEARQQAIENWNTRKPMDNIVAELESRKELLNMAKISTTQKNVGQNAYNIAIDIAKAGGVE